MAYLNIISSIHKISGLLIFTIFTLQSTLMLVLLSIELEDLLWREDSKLSYADGLVTVQNSFPQLQASVAVSFLEKLSVKFDING
jgi:hypothetical protein